MIPVRPQAKSVQWGQRHRRTFQTLAMRMKTGQKTG